jgi:hypothetical protein
MRRNCFCLVAAALCLAACAAGVGDGERRTRALVYGEDDRLEYYDVAAAESRERIAQSMVALIPRGAISVRGREVEISAASWGELGGLCPRQRFFDQPSAAFCSGVLVDWDLVLTAGHCTRVLATNDYVAVFGYYYAAAGRLAVAADDVVGIAAIEAERLDPIGAEPRLDYAWLRLDRAAPESRRPTPVSGPASTLAKDTPIIAASAGNGVPIKLDAGGRVIDARETSLDYFVADTDTSHGSSGGGAFDARLSLVGVLARGGTDLELTEAGCWEEVRAVSGEGTEQYTEEQYTYARRAVEDVCAGSSADRYAICRADCGDPCQAGTRPLDPATGCVLAAANPAGALPWWMLLLLLIRRRGRQSSPAPGDHVRGSF